MSARGWLVVVFLFGPQLMKSFQANQQSRFYAQMVAAAANGTSFEPSTEDTQESSTQEKQPQEKVKRKTKRGKRGRGATRQHQQQIDSWAAAYKECTTSNDTGCTNDLDWVVDEIDADNLLHEVYEVVINHSQELPEYCNNEPLLKPCYAHPPVLFIYNPFSGLWIPMLPISPFSR